MSKPMTATQLIKQLKEFKVPYMEFGTWKTHNRNSVGSWGPVHGFMVHHTGSDSTDQKRLLRDGRSDLPGPLSHFGIAQDGTVWLIGWGRCNHAGKGDPDVLSAVIAESYGTKPPTDNQATVDGNRYFYGVEIWYSGSHGMTSSQYASLLKLSAAVCDFHGWSEKSIIGHGEWQPGKWDPGYKNGTMMDMNAVRNDVKAALNRETGNKENTVEKSETYKQVWDTDAATAPRYSPTVKTNTKWKPISFLQEIYNLCVEIRNAVVVQNPGSHDDV
jgi:hypothetical protein